MQKQKSQNQERGRLSLCRGCLPPGGSSKRDTAPLQIDLKIPSRASPPLVTLSDGPAKSSDWPLSWPLAGVLWEPHPPTEICTWALVGGGLLQRVLQVFVSFPPAPLSSRSKWSFLHLLLLEPLIMYLLSVI